MWLRIVLFGFSIMTMNGSFFSQDKQVFTGIDFLNLIGTFTKHGDKYIDSSNTTSGIVNVNICTYYSSKTIAQQAFVKDTIIAEHNIQHAFIRLIYTDKDVFCKFKHKDFKAFLKQNTENGHLVDRSKLTYDGKTINLFCTLNRRTYRLSKKCN